MGEIHGEVADGWGTVADAFRANFADHGELGAAFAVYVGGAPVVDLWGGVADRRTGRPWDRDTIAVSMSTTKGAVALCANRLVERGLLDVDAPVATYWPEFAAAGKGDIPVRWLLSHQAGLPAVDGSLTLADVCAWDPVVRALEAQAPAWEPGAEHGYHAHTFGFLVGEVIRRVAGVTVGTMFADEVARPLGLHSWIGLPAAEAPRVAQIEPAPPPPPDVAAIMAEMFGPDTIFGRSMMLSGAFPLDLVTESGGFNAPEAHRAELPQGNLITDARSVARMYAAIVGTVDGIRLLGDDALAAATTQLTDDAKTYGRPGMEAMALRFGLGFMLASNVFPGIGPRSFGHPGAGGAFGVADPDAQVAVGYVVNQLQMSPAGDPRVAGLLGAVRSSLG